MFPFRFTSTASVYTPNPTTGAYTVLALQGVACRLSPLPLALEAQRAEGVEQRRLRWDAAVAFPPHAQIEVDGERWNVVANSEQVRLRLAGGPAFRACDVVRG